MGEHDIKSALNTKQQKVVSKSLKEVHLPEVRSVSNARRDCSAQTATFVRGVMAVSIYDGTEARLVMVVVCSCFSKPYRQ